MAWGIFGPWRFLVTRKSGNVHSVTVFGAWMTGVPLLSWWITGGGGENPGNAFSSAHAATSRESGKATSDWE